ncbi:MAG: L,D-transpeptidase [Caldilineaceae bacterium]|nr:L,D-transpeptidase [Caldilineaceae bacterium]
MTKLLQIRSWLIPALFAILAPLLFVEPARAFSMDNGIVSPQAAAVVNGTVAVEGVAQHPGFRKWQLDLLVSGDEQHTRFIAVGEEAQPQPNLLTHLDTTRYPNGQHLLRLRVVYTGLNYDEYHLPITIRNGLPAETVAPAVETDEAEEVTTPPEAPPLRPTAPEILVWEDGVLGAGVPDGHRWVEISISEQTLTAWQGDTPVLRTQVSTGKPGWRTLPGTFNVYVKLPQTRMRGPGYDTPDVPWTMYYYQGFAIHGAYWHNNFGAPVSHGCVNLRVDEAKLLFDWADVGLEVVVKN